MRPTILPYRKLTPLPVEPRPLLFGHRGYSVLAPENTLAAFGACVDAGVPGVELDIHRCGSGELVVIHDETLERTTGKQGSVEELSYREYADLDAGSWFDPAFSDERIPLLRQVFERFGDSLYYDIEIKTSSHRPEPLAQALLEVIGEFDLTRKCVVSSFNPMAVRAFKIVAPEIPTATLYSRHSGIPPLLRHGEGRFLSRTDFLKPAKELVNRRSMFLLKSLGRYPILPWTVDDIEEAGDLLDLGVTGLVTNRPGEMLPLIRRTPPGLAPSR
jgi:glycerophosphoryl diester phosphodiesterase